MPIARPAAGSPSPAVTLPARAIRVGVVDDHAVVRSCVVRYLEQQEGIRVAGQAAGGREAIDLVRTTEVDVLLLDLDMPGQNGIDALGMIQAKSRVPRLAVLVFSGYPEHLYALRFLRLGASGYLNKCCPPAEIVKAIRHVAQGRRYITPPVAELLEREFFGAASGSPHEQLSTRELQMLVKLARGRSASEVAADLSLNAETVRCYRTRLMHKLAVGTPSGLVEYALRHQLVD